MTANEGLRLLEEIEANRALILAAYSQNAELLQRADERIRSLLSPLPTAPAVGDNAETNQT